MEKFVDDYNIYSACERNFNDRQNEFLVSGICNGTMVNYRARAVTFESDVMYVLIHRGKTEANVSFVFLGSNDIRDWLSNVNADVDSEYNMHDGFLDAAKGFNDRVLSESLEIEKEYNGKVNYRFLGYSRGAPLAAISAFIFSKRTDGKHKSRTSVGMFANPRFLTIKSLNDFNNWVLPSMCYRAIIVGDPVTDIPTTRHGYCDNNKINTIILPGSWWSGLPFTKIRIHKSYRKAVDKYVSLYGA